MKQFLRNCLNKTGFGKRFIDYFHHRKSAFQPASWEPFSPLNRWGRKKAIDAAYSAAFDRLFILAKSLHLKGDVFEFGVFQGYTSLLFAKYIKKFALTNTSLHLFDSFEGLPEGNQLDSHSYEYAAGVWVKGSMMVRQGLEQYIQKKLSKIMSPQRVHVVKGFFEDTLETYFKNLTPKARVVHIDCDLYSASKYVFEFLLTHEVIQDGTLLIFDDWMTSLGNPNLGQRKAVHETLEKYSYWSIEKMFSFGIGSHVFIAHDLRVKSASQPRGKDADK